MNVKVQVPSIIDDEITTCLNEMLFDFSVMLQFFDVQVQYTTDVDYDTYVYECGDFFLDNMTSRDVLWYTITSECEAAPFDQTHKWIGVADRPSLIIITPKTQHDYIRALNTYANSYVQIAINPKHIDDGYNTVRQTEEGWTLYWDGAVPF